MQQQTSIVALDKAYAAKRGGGTIAGYKEIHLLDAGAIAIFDEENNLMTTATTAVSLKAVQKFYIAQGGISATDAPKISGQFDKNAMHAIYIPYVAPVLQVVKVGKVATAGTLGLPTLTDGMIASVVITDRSTGDIQALQLKRYSIAVTAADTATTITTRLAAAINANPDSIVVATVVNGADDNHIVLTAKTVDTNFTVGVDDIIATATNTITAYGFSGQGTYAKVAKAVVEGDISRGDAHYFHYHNLGTAADGGNGLWNSSDVLSSVANTTTFHSWTIQWIEEVKRPHTVIPTSIQTLMLFIIVAGTGLADTNTIMNVIYGGTNDGSGGSASGSSSGEAATIAVVPAGGQG
jgi:hypothetical protein